jgi:hypothetical protein
MLGKIRHYYYDRKALFLGTKLIYRTVTFKIKNKTTAIALNLLQSRGT